METALNVLYGTIGVIIGAILLTYLTQGTNQSDAFATGKKKKSKQKRLINSSIPSGKESSSSV